MRSYFNRGHWVTKLWNLTVFVVVFCVFFCVLRMCNFDWSLVLSKSCSEARQSRHCLILISLSHDDQRCQPSVSSLIEVSFTTTWCLFTIWNKPTRIKLNTQKTLTHKKQQKQWDLGLSDPVSVISIAFQSNLGNWKCGSLGPLLVEWC